MTSTLNKSNAYGQSCECAKVDTNRRYGSLRSWEKGRKSKRFGVFYQIGSVQFQPRVTTARSCLARGAASLTADWRTHLGVMAADESAVYFNSQSGQNRLSYRVPSIEVAAS